ncbi:hypothetical protein E4U53_006854 [Claviceps sorghi]|nr:hypothetical protein E4U53_006854 [Claviceps sorghi]
MFPSLTAVLALATAVLANTRITPPHGALIVGNGHYATIQAAVNALDPKTRAAQSIFIYPGTYKEQVTIDDFKSPLAIYGYTRNTSSYTANQVNIVAGHSQKDRPHNESTATLRVKIPNFKLYNVNVVNSFGQGSQAIALSAYEPNQGYYGCQFKGFQDTVLAQRGAQYYAGCYIEGATDFIFGQGANAFFDKCTIGVVPTSANVGYITASGRDSPNSPSYYVFDRTTIAAAPGHKVPAGIYFLGRPWRPSARVAFQRCSMSNVINKAGWSQWSISDTRLSNAKFGELGNFGPGATGPRAKFSYKLPKLITISDILGSNFTNEYYFDGSYLH